MENNIKENKCIDYKKRINKALEAIINITNSHQKTSSYMKGIRKIAEFQIKNLNGIENKRKE